MANLTKVIKAHSTNQVWLRIGGLTWSNLPLRIKDELLRSLDRIADIRGDIGSRAKVRTMPPVQVVGQIWFADTGGIIDGRLHPLRLQKHVVFGTQIPVLTAMCDDGPIVRRILVHEFLHCFFYYVAGISSPGKILDLHHVATDAAADHAKLENANDWFADEDADALMLHNDPALDVIEYRLSELRPFFPTLVPDLQIRGKKWGIPEDVQAHALELLQKRQAEGPSCPD
jgi:hypothetical protein